MDESLSPLLNVSVWKQGDRRAPHKPLLLLSALAAVQRGEPRQQPYEKIHDSLSELLVDFGHAGKSVHPEYPFWRLQNDGAFWEIPQREKAIALRGDRMRTGDVPPGVLREAGATGGFSEEVHRALTADPSIVNRIASVILDEHFPRSMHEDLLDAVAMPWVVDSAARRKRSPEFRESLIRLYQQRCAMCGFDGRLAGASLALEAAHIKWHAHGGPDKPGNGLLLCSIHHKALDRGALGLSRDKTILVSQHVRGGSQVDEWIIGLRGQDVASPIDPKAGLLKEFIEWHHDEVFLGPEWPDP